MSKIILATAANPPYFTKIKPYLLNISSTSRASENRFYMVDETFNDYEKIPNIICKNLDPSEFKTPNANTCIQHGEFIDLDDYLDDDVVIFTDGDIRLQRWLSNSESECLLNLKHGELLLARNAAMVLPEAQDTLGVEATRLGLTKSLDDILGIMGENGSVKNYKCYNTGVVICRADTYKILFNLYTTIFPVIKMYFTHYAVQQWILSYICNKYLNVLPLSKAIHSHGCYGCPVGVTKTASGITHFDNTPIVFSHLL